MTGEGCVPEIGRKYRRKEDSAIVEVIGFGRRGVRLKVQHRRTSWFTWWVARATFAEGFEVES
mgnify:CR=1 FL=1